MKRFLCFSLVLFPISVFAEGGLPDKPYIHVEGYAEVEKPADTATFKFDVVKSEAEQAKANAEVQALAGKIFALLKEHKVGENDVIAQSIATEPEIEHRETERNYYKVIGHTVRRGFEIKVRDITIIPKFVDELIEIGGVEMHDIESDYSKRKEMEDQLWLAVLNNARERAEASLKAMNMKIDSVFAVSPEAFTQIEEKMLGPEKVIVTGMNIPTAVATYRLKQSDLAKRFT